MERELRRHRDTLIAAGTGVMVFGSWSVIRSVIYFIIGMRDIQNTFPERLTDALTLTLLYVLLFAVLAFDLVLRFYIGLNARAEGKAKRTGVLYLVVAGILAATYLYAIPQDLLVFSRGRESVWDTVASLWIDLTSLATLLALLYAAIRTKRLIKQGVRA